MIEGKSKDYKGIYYKSNSDKESFEKYLMKEFDNNISYDLSVHKHDKGVLFTTEKRWFLCLIKNRIEGVFSQKDGYSLLAIYFFTNNYFTHYINIIIIFLALNSLFDFFIVHYTVLKIINSAILLIVIFSTFLEFIVCFIEKRKYVDILKKDIDKPKEIKLDDYNSLIGDEELL
jgi:hypothetical protein